jgi:hypothetical protein
MFNRTEIINIDGTEYNKETLDVETNSQITNIQFANARIKCLELDLKSLENLRHETVNKILNRRNGG